MVSSYIRPLRSRFLKEWLAKGGFDRGLPELSSNRERAGARDARNGLQSLPSNRKNPAQAGFFHSAGLYCRRKIGRITAANAERGATDAGPGHRHHRRELGY